MLEGAEQERWTARFQLCQAKDGLPYPCPGRLNKERQRAHRIFQALFLGWKSRYLLQWTDTAFKPWQTNKPLMWSGVRAFLAGCHKGRSWAWLVTRPAKAVDHGNAALPTHSSVWWLLWVTKHLSTGLPPWRAKTSWAGRLQGISCTGISGSCFPLVRHRQFFPFSYFPSR